MAGFDGKPPSTSPWIGPHATELGIAFLNWENVERYIVDRTRVPAETRFSVGNRHKPDRIWRGARGESYRAHDPPSAVRQKAFLRFPHVHPEVELRGAAPDGVADAASTGELFLRQ